MFKFCSIVLVSMALVITNVNDSLAQGKTQTMTTTEIFRQLIKAQKKTKIVQVTLKDRSNRWGRVVEVSATGFSLSTPAATRSDMKILLRYDEITSVHYETGWNRFVKGIRDIVTAPVVIPVFTIWWLQGHGC